MGIYIRQDSPYFWLLLDGFRTASGRPRREPTKVRHDAPTSLQRKDARQLAEVAYHDRMTALARGEVTPEPTVVPTFAVQAAWFTTHKLPHRRGREREAPLIPKLVAVFGDQPLSAITRSLVTERWITPRLTTPTIIARKTRTAARRVTAGPRTVNREVGLLKAILQSAVPEYLETSPLYGMPLVPTTTPKRRLMTDDEERRLLAVMAADDRALFLLGLDSLVRLTDLLDLTRGDDRGRTIYVADPKAGGGFEVPISGRARKALDAWYRASPDPISRYIFPRRRRAKTERDRRNGIRQMLERACAAADPPIPSGRRADGLTFHWATRRTGATRMLVGKHDLGTVQKIGRWKTPDVVLGIYHDLVDEAAHAAVNAVRPRRRRGASRDRRV